MIIFLIIISIALLILIHEFGHFIAAKAFGLLVEEFGIGFPPRLFSKKIGETNYSVNLIPFGGFVRIFGESYNQASTPASPDSISRSFYFQPAWKKTIVILAGVFMNFIIGWLIVSAIFMVGAPEALVINMVSLESPAESVGLKVGDQILGFGSSEEFIDFIDQNKGEEIILKIQSAGEESEIKIIPRLAPPAGEGSLGIQFTEVGLEKIGFFAAIGEGFKTSFAIVTAIFQGLGQILIGLVTTGSLAEGFVGPIGIFGFASQAAGLGLAYFLQLIGLISLNLFALNILPFPALDGGRLLFIIIEKIKGSPLSANFERSANATGFLILILLMIAVTVRDVIRLF